MEAPSNSINRVVFRPDGLTFKQPALLAMSYANCSVSSNGEQRIVYVNEGKVQLKDYLGPLAESARQMVNPSTARDAGSVEQKILDSLSKSHRFFAEILGLFPREDFGAIARAIGELTSAGKITQDSDGKYQPAAEGLSQTR